jgi:hypothetical protein
MLESDSETLFNDGQGMWPGGTPLGHFFLFFLKPHRFYPLQVASQTPFALFPRFHFRKYSLDFLEIADPFCHG